MLSVSLYIRAVLVFNLSCLHINIARSSLRLRDLIIAWVVVHKSITGQK